MAVSVAPVRRKFYTSRLKKNMKLSLLIDCAENEAIFLNAYLSIMRTNIRSYLDKSAYVPKVAISQRRTP